MTTLNFPHQDDNNWLMIDVGGQKKPQYPSPLEVKMLIEEAVRAERSRIYGRLAQMKSVYETMDTGSALGALLGEDIIREVTPNHQD